MRPLFTVHAGEYLVGSYIEQNHPWNVWVPSKDTGIDLLVTDSENRRSVSLQVKFSTTHKVKRPHPIRDLLMATGWWTHDETKIEESKADFWVLVLRSLLENRTSFVVIPPQVLLGRLQCIHSEGGNKIQSYISVTKSGQCWETRGLANADLKRIVESDVVGDCSVDKQRNLGVFLNAWGEIAKILG